MNISRQSLDLFTDWEAVVKLSDDFNGADLRNVCTEAGKNPGFNMYPTYFVYWQFSQE